jgi:heme exporter protein C
MISRKYLQWICISLLLWSIAGGLLVPLSPNIETVEYQRNDSTISFKVGIPKLKESVEDFYLIASSSSLKSKRIIHNQSVTKKSGNYEIEFLNPNRFNEVLKGDAFDLVAKTNSAGYLHSFLAYYVDSAIGGHNFEPMVLDKLVAPFRFSFPNRAILQETIRNLFFHVPMWFTMMALLVYSLVNSILFLHSGDLKRDIKAKTSAQIAIYFGLLGLLTGMVWARYTWGAFWPKEEWKLDGAAIGMLAYMAYFVLRSSVDDEIKRAKLSSVYNVFAFVIYFVFIWIVPRIQQSLHPGNGGNPGFNIYEQDNIMRMFFYPAVIGWIMLAFWMRELYAKAEKEAI